MRIEMWLVVALAGACGSKEHRSKHDPDAVCDELPDEITREACRTEYNKRGKTTDASFYLNKIGKSAKRVFVETGKYPAGDARHPGGAVSCCGAGSAGTRNVNTCVPHPEGFAADPVWSKLEFSVDEPTAYQYEYHSVDGVSFTAYAFGDLDCDGKVATFTLLGTLTAKGNPVVNIVPPPSGIY